MMPCSGARDARARRLRDLFAASSFSAHLLLTSGTNIVIAVLGVLTGSMAARLLGPAGRGELAAVQMWAVAFGNIANLGLPQALTFYAAQSAHNAGRFLGSATMIGLLASFVFMGLGYLVLPMVLSAQPPDVVGAARWYLLLLPIQAVVSMPYHLLRGRSDFAVWNPLRLAPGVGWLGVLVFCWLRSDSDPQRLAYLYLGALALVGVLTFSAARWRVAGPFRPDTSQWRPLLTYGLPTVLSSVPYVLNLRLDQMLMAAFLPAQILGFYVVAVTWSAAVVQLPSALGTVLFPRTASQTERTQRELVFAQGCRLAVLTALSVALVVAVITPYALPLLFGDQFRASIPAALVLVAAAAVSSINLVFEEGLRGLGQPSAALWAEVAGLVVTAISLLVLLRPFELLGAALASVLGYSAVTAALAVFSLRTTRHSLGTLLYPDWRDIERILQRLQLWAAAPAKQVSES
jgi:O-antigen/teichoic acid export membrane protein